MPVKHCLPFLNGWKLWRCVPLRGTGFPSRDILRLAAPTASSAILQITELEDQIVHDCAEAQSLLKQLFESGEIERPALRKALGKLRKSRSPNNKDQLGSAQTTVERLIDLEQRLCRAERDFESAFDIDRGLISEHLAQVARDPRFVEAILWQNSEAANLVLPRVADSTRPLNRSMRQAQGLVTNYLQRYCVKNDTIGFFGPVGWAQLSEEETIRVVPGPTLLRKRQVYFEHWALERVANKFATNEELRQHLPPRLLPTVRIEGVQVHYGIGQQTEVPRPVAQLLSLCDGIRSAHHIATSLCERGEAEFEDSDEVMELLENLCDKGLITWTLELPSGGPDPALVLVRTLEGLPDSTEKSEALLRFRELDSARDALARSAGKPDEIRTTRAALDKSFIDLVGEPATRNAGEMYAGRTIVYEDCQRDITLSLGKLFVERFGGALSLMFTSARWFSFEFAREYLALADNVFESMNSGNDEVPYIEFWKKLSVYFPGEADDTSEIAARIRGDLARKWTQIFGIEESMREVKLRSADIRSAAEKEFSAPAPGWPSARHVAPDIMLAARSAEALGRGDFGAVLGEIHLGNTIPSTVRMQQHAAPLEIFQWNDADFGEGIVCPVQPTDLVTRADRVSWSANDFSLELGSTRSWRSRDRVLRPADYVVRKIDGALRVEELRGSKSFGILAFIDQYLMFISTSNFSWTPPWKHVPRVRVDELVVIREQWRFDTETIDFVKHNEGSEQFLSCNKWAKAVGLPRWVFFKIPEETKPVFLDFQSPVLVARARALLQKSQRVTISEMSPSFDEMWLPDHEGNCYASEIRIVGVDPEHWQGHGSTRL